MSPSHEPDVEAGVRLEHRKVGGQHVFTSPDLPGIYVAHKDRAVARSSVGSAVALLQRMQERRAQRLQIKRQSSVA